MSENVSTNTDVSSASAATDDATPVTDSPKPASGTSESAVAEPSDGAHQSKPPATAEGKGGLNSNNPDDPTAAQAAQSPSQASPSIGAESSVGEAASDSPDGTGSTPAAAATEGITADGDGAKKKRRRRRKKKKPGEGVAADGDTKKTAYDRTPFQIGEEVFGRVTAVLEEAIMVDLSGKALAIFDRREMADDDLLPNEGDRFLASVHQDGLRGGLVVLTRKPLREEESKPLVEAALKEGKLVQGLVTGVIKGGVDVDINGLRAFAPASGMDLHPHNANFASLVGQRLEFKVSQFEKAGRDVVITRRPMLEAEAHERRKKALEIIEPEKVMQGVVRTVVDWGVFVALLDAENLEGLVHVSEASHDPRARLVDLFKPGDRFEVKILKVDEKGKIWLSRKALVADPWKEAKENYPSGAKFKTKITRVEKFGAFCQLEGIEGLIHISDLSFSRVEDINDVVKEGDELEVVVHQFDLRNHKVALHPALVGDRAEETPQKVTKNAGLNVEVVKPESAGLRVRVLGATGRHARGFIPAGQTGTERGTDLRKKFPVGTKLRVAVLDLDPRRGEPKLSIRRYEENEERTAHREYRKKVAAESKFGTLGDLLKKSLS